MTAKHNEKLSLKKVIDVKGGLLSQRNNIGNISYLLIFFLEIAPLFFRTDAYFLSLMKTLC